MRQNVFFLDFSRLFRRSPNAIAVINGIEECAQIRGFVRFYDVRDGVIVRAEITGLPVCRDKCCSQVFGFHIHTNGDCGDGFSRTGGHYDSHGCPHSYHSGDMPPLFGVNGKAASVFLTDRFTVGEIIGRSVVIHSAPDDFTSQPAGNSGRKIACGVIVPVR